MMKKILLFLLLACLSFSFAQTVGEFRTSGNGNWNDPASWQVCTSMSPETWNPATNYPGQDPGGNYKVTILPSHTINTTGVASVIIGNLYVKGILNVTADFDIKTFGSGPAPYLFVQNGRINLSKNVTLKLPAGSNIYMNITDASTQGFHEVNGCSGSTRVIIGGNNNVFTACQGTPSESFPAVNAAAADGTILADVQPSTICLGGSVNLIGDKFGNATPTEITWKLIQKPSGPVSNILGTSPTVPYTINVGSAILDEAGDYVFEFSFKIGNATKTKTVNVRVNGPTFTTTPAATTTYCQNNAASPLSVVASGAGTLTYQWYSNTTNSNTGGTPIAGAQSSSYTPPTATAGTLYYYVVVTAACGVAKSNAAQVIVNQSTASVTTQPISNSYCQNATAAALTVAGNNVTGYQWYSNTTNSNTGGTAISGAVSASYTPSTATVGTFYYYALLNGTCGAAPSNVATITVTPINTVSAASSTPTLCINTLLSPVITHTTTGATGIDTPTGLPIGVTASWSSNKITISGTPIVSGTFNYTIPLTGGCGTINATGTITVTAAVSAGTVSGTSPLFVGDLTTYTSNGSPGGTWSSSNTSVFTVNPTTGQVTAQGAGTATITYTVTGCGGTASATATVVVTDVTTWNGLPATGSWDHGVPNGNKKAAIAGSYETSAKGDFIAKTLTVHSGATLTISPNTYVEVLNEVTNNGRLIVESDGNLKQINNVANSGNIKVRRTHTLTELRKEYNFLSSPVANQNMKMIYGNNAANVPFVTVLRESTNSFVNATLTDYAVVAKGFSVKEPRLTYEDLSGDSLPVYEAQYKGVPNNGDITLAFPTYTAGRGYNLAGNPYPSNIDLIDLYRNSDPTWEEGEPIYIDPTFRFWDNTVNDIYVQMGGAYQGYSYALFNAKTDLDGFGVRAPGKGGVDDPKGSKIPFRIIKVSQGFMVRARQAGASLKFNNSMRRTSNTDTEFFGRNSTRNRYRLQLVKSDGFTLQNGIAYFAAGNNLLGAEDTRIPNSSASDALFTYAGDAKVVINGRSAFAPDDVLTVGTRHFTTGTYTIQAVDEEGVFANGQPIYLKDKQLGIMTDLTKGDYTFTSDSGEYTNRFEIVYTPALVLATDTVVKSMLEVYRDATDFVIRSSDKAIETMELYDASGRLVLSQKGNGKELRFSATRLSEGMYVVKALLKDGQELTKKIRK